VIVVVLVVAVVLYLAARLVRWNQVRCGKVVQDGVARRETITVSPDRAEFLSELFGLTSDDCERLSFDGHEFRFPSPVPYSSFRAARLGDGRLVVTRDESIMTSQTWLHTRVDGGPDRRFSHNPRTMFAYQRVVTFSGPQDTRYLPVFGQPSPGNRMFGYSAKDEAADAVRRMNDFLTTAAGVRLEEHFSTFAASDVELRRAQAAVEDCERKLSEARRAREAHIALERAGGSVTAVDREIADKARSDEQGAEAVREQLIAAAKAADGRKTEALVRASAAVEARQAALQSAREQVDAKRILRNHR
jgi:hypothetical protein